MVVLLCFVLASDDKDAAAHAMAAIDDLFSGRHDDAMRRLRRAIELDPNSSFAHGMLSAAYAFGGEADLAIQQAQTAIRLSPRDFLNVIWHVTDAWAHLSAERFEEAAECARRAIASSAGVLLTSHPSLTGINTGTGLSGSTAWTASVRSRLYFKRAVTEKDEEPDPDLRVLEVMKNNYGPVGETINLRWKNGLFLPVGGVTNLEKLAAEQAARHLFLNLLNQFTSQGRNVSDKPSANNYAPVAFAREKAAREAGIRKAAFELAMRELFAADKIRVETYGQPSRGWSKLVLK